MGRLVEVIMPRLGRPKAESQNSPVPPMLENPTKMEEQTMEERPMTKASSAGAEREGGMRDLKSDATLGAGLLAPLAEQDNWRHRSTSMQCKTCMFFVEKWTSKPQHDGHRIGRCRQLAPTMKGWPVVFSDDWCGAHKLDEEKI